MGIRERTLYKILKKMGITRMVLFVVCRWNDFTRAIILGMLYTRDFFITINLLFYCVLHKKSPLEGTSAEPLIVSLTTYPARIKTVHITLYTLLRQSLKPDKIVLWLSEEEFGDKFEKKNKFPFLLRLLIKRGIQTQWVSKNYKVYNKLLPSLKEFPNASIVVCDDDAIYPRWWLKDLYEAHLETPECIVGHKGFILSKMPAHEATTQRTIKPSLNKYNVLEQMLRDDLRNKDVEKYRKPNVSIFLEGVGGVLFPPHSLPAEVHKKELFQKLSPHADDIWFNAMAMRKGTLKRVVDRPEYLPQLVAGTQQVGLARINLDQGKNDEQFAQVFDYFDLYGLVE